MSPVPLRAIVSFAAALLSLTALSSVPAPSQQAEEPEDPSREQRRVVESVEEDRWAALALRNGRIVVYDLVGGRRHEWEAPAEPVRALALDPMGISALPPNPAGAPPAAGEAPVVLVCTPGPGQEETTLHVVRGDSGVRLQEMRIPGAPVALLVAPGEGHAYVITAMAGRKRGDQVEPPGRWTVRSINLTTAKVEAAVTHDGAAHAASLSPGGDRLYVATDDTIRTFSTHPLHSSWMLRSPGRNLLVEPIGTAGAVAAVRDSQLAVLNPDNLPGRDGPGGVPPNDDAVVAIELPFIGRHLDVNGDTGEAIVLDARGTRLATVDLERAEVSDVEQVPEVAAAIYHPDRESLVLFEAHADRVFEMLHEPPDRGDVAAGARAPAPEPPTPAKGATVASADPTAAHGTPGSDTPRKSGPPPSPVPGEGEGEATRPAPEPAQPDATEAGPGESPSSAATPPILAPEPPAEPAESAPSGPAVLAGRITGDLSLVEAVVLYGPDSVLREQARIAPAPDGSFLVPETPAGKYRVVVAGKGGVQLRCSPPMRIVQVGRGVVPLLDFEVSGQVKGRLAP